MHLSGEMVLKLVHSHRQVFNIIVEDNHQIRSLVRYIGDFDEFDQKVSRDLASISTSFFA